VCPILLRQNRRAGKIEALLLLWRRFGRQLYRRLRKLLLTGHSVPQWVKAALDQWIRAAGVREGRIFRAVARAGKVWGQGISQNVVWYVVKGCCEKAGLEHIAPHDLRRTCAKLCHCSGGELEQIQFLLGHASVQTTERYLG